MPPLRPWTIWWKWSLPMGSTTAPKAEAAVAAAHTTMLALAIATTLIGLTLAVAFAHSMSKPIFAAMQIAEHVAAGNFTDRIELGGAMSLVVF